MTPPPRVRPGAVAALVFVMLLGGAVPAAQVIEARTRSGQAATVESVDRDGLRPEDRGVVVGFVLPDGSTGSTYLRPQWNHPDPGETITVYRRDERWHATAEFPWLSAIGGGAVFLGVGALLVAWIVADRRHRRRRGDLG